jgi:hypothetical protein
MRLRGSAVLLAALCSCDATASPTRLPAKQAEAVHPQASPPPALLRDLLSPGSVCADKSDAGFYAVLRHQEACPCDCRGCRCSSYVACWACDPPPCKQQAFYECEANTNTHASYFNEVTQECAWLPLRTPPFDCPLVRAIMLQQRAAADLFRRRRPNRRARRGRPRRLRNRRRLQVRLVLRARRSLLAGPPG